METKREELKAEISRLREENAHHAANYKRLRHRCEVVWGLIDNNTDLIGPLELELGQRKEVPNAAR